MSLEELRINIAVNCWTPTVLSHRIGAQMVERGRGATASANFKGAAPDAYDDVAGGSTAGSRILSPSTPQDVAERLFERLDAGPRQYSNAHDEDAAAAAAARPRNEVVQAMGEITSRLARFSSPGSSPGRMKPEE